MPFLRVASLLLVIWALQTQVAHAQEFHLDSIKLARTGGVYMPAAQRAMLFYLDQSGGRTSFRQYALDSSLRVRHRHDLRLPGRYDLVNQASSRHHLLYQLRRRGSDSIVTAVLDSTGRAVVLERKRDRMLRWQELRGADFPLTNGFLVSEPGRKRGPIMVRFLDTQLRTRWSHGFASESGGAVTIDDMAADSTHLWLMVTSNAQSRRATSKAYCMELATGRVLCRLPLDYSGERRVPGIISMGLKHSLLVAGYSYANMRPSRVNTGNLFYTQLSPDSARLTNRLVKLGQDPILRAARQKVLWQVMAPDAAGNVRLVGETYTSTSLGGHIALGVATGIATLGIVRLNITTLHPRDLLTLQLTPTSQITEVRVMPLPDGGSYTTGGYLQARRMAKQAAMSGVFRLRGLTPDSNHVVLRTPRRVLTYDLRTGQPSVVQQVPATGYLDLWHAGPQRLLLYHEQRAQHRLQLQQASYKVVPVL
ncbi:hypothetical protein [Hymenobacter koreensis]|uniref:Uncharacterized protein n=1 Tax=Hymenobacter koreensis TaxID=1084523 RepID=A0ABP8IXJ9_9BACT